jgi:hypothetical protein
MVLVRLTWHDEVAMAVARLQLAWRRWRLASSDTVRSAAIGRYPTWDLAHAENGRRPIGVGRLCYSCHTVNFLKRGLSNSTRLHCRDEFCGYGEL